MSTINNNIQTNNAPVNTQIQDLDGTIGKLAGLGDKIGAVSDSINSLVEKLVGEQEALGDARESLSDAKKALADHKANKPTFDASVYYKKDGNGAVVYKDGKPVIKDGQAENLTKAQGEFESKTAAWEKRLGELEDKVVQCENKVTQCEQQIDKTKEQIKTKERELDTVKAQLRQEQINLGNSSGSEATKKELDTVFDDGISKIDDIKAEIKKVMEKGETIPTGTAAGKSLGSVSGQSSGINTDDGTKGLSGQIGATWGAYSADFNAARQAGNTNGMQERFAAFVGDIKANGMPTDVNDLVQAVLREAYMENTADLGFHAQKVKYFNECKKVVRGYVQELRDYKTAMATAAKKDGYSPADPPGKDKSITDWNNWQAQYVSTHPGTTPAHAVTGKNNDIAESLEMPTTTPPKDCTTMEELDGEITRYEEKLSTIGDDAQLANIDLQNMLQKQQQTIQMLSNVSKMLSDTALAVIRKIG